MLSAFKIRRQGRFISGCVDKTEDETKNQATEGETKTTEETINFIASKAPGSLGSDEKRQFQLIVKSGKGTLEYQDMNGKCLGRFHVRLDDPGVAQILDKDNFPYEGDVEIMPDMENTTPLVIRGKTFKFVDGDRMIAHERAKSLLNEEANALIESHNVLNVLKHALRTLPSIMFVTHNDLKYHFCHGGIDKFDVTKYMKNDDSIEVLESEIVDGWKWNDFTCNERSKTSDRGNGFKVHGRGDTMRYLNKNGLTSIVRGHQDSNMLTVMYKKRRCDHSKDPGIRIDFVHSDEIDLNMKEVAVLTTSAAAPMRLMEDEIVYCRLAGDAKMHATRLKLEPIDHDITASTLKEVLDEVTAVESKGCNSKTLEALATLPHMQMEEPRGLRWKRYEETQQPSGQSVNDDALRTALQKKIGDEVEFTQEEFNAFDVDVGVLQATDYVILWNKRDHYTYFRPAIQTLQSSPFKDPKSITKFFDDDTMMECVQEFLGNVDSKVVVRTATEDKNIVLNKTFKEEDTILIVGDLHSGLHALVKILQDWISKGYMTTDGTLAANHYVVFLGDLIDRGYFSTEILFLVFSLSNANPNRVFVLNGNHEDFEVWHKYGFRDELMKEYNLQGVRTLAYEDRRRS